MRLVFQGWRRGHYKVTGSVIDESFRRGHEVLLMHGKAGKPGEDVTCEALAARWPQALIVSGVGHHLPAATAILGDPSVGDACSFPACPNVPVYALDFVWEQRMRSAIPGVTRCWATEYHRARFGRSATMVSACNPGTWVRRGDVDPDTADGPVTGMTALDALPLVDPETVRKKYGLDRPAVLLFSLKLGVPHLWRKTVFRHWHYPAILHAIRDYCDNTGRLLVVKTRQKNHDPNLVHRLADRVIGDESLWPYTSAELLRVADLAIHFQSGAVFEAVAAGVPQLSIRIPQPHLVHFPGHDLFFGHAPSTVQAWPHVVWSLDYRDVAGYLGTFVTSPTVDEMERQRYAERYIGPLDGKSASRVLDMVERCG